MGGGGFRKEANVYFIPESVFQYKNRPLVALEGCRVCGQGPGYTRMPLNGQNRAIKPGCSL